MPCYVVALAAGADVDYWRSDPEEGDTSVLPVPGFFTDTARVAGYAATRSEDLVLQLHVIIDASGHDGRLWIDPKAVIGLGASASVILTFIDGLGLPSATAHWGGGGSASTAGSPVSG